MQTFEEQQIRKQFTRQDQPRHDAVTFMPVKMSTWVELSCEAP